MDRRRWLTLPLCALALAACGSSGSGDKLSKADLVAKADNICKDAKKKTDSLQPKNLNDTNKLADASAKAADIVKSAASDLKGLTPPDDLKGDYDTFTSYITTQGDKASEFADAIKSKDREKIRQVVAQLQKDQGKAKAAAKRIGLKECLK